jgi:hypothetical protein
MVVRVAFDAPVLIAAKPGAHKTRFCKGQVAARGMARPPLIRMRGRPHDPRKIPAERTANELGCIARTALA